MITNIEISKAASYGESTQYLSELSRQNFIFGANGSGKTTVSRLIANETHFPASKIFWSGGVKLETLVYNRDFVAANFGESTQLKGVFTLGESTIELQSSMSERRKEIQDFGSRVENLKRSLVGEDGAGGLTAQLAVASDVFVQACWKKKQEHDEIFAGAFAGVRGNREKFKDRVLLEMKSNLSTLLPIEQLETRANTLFGDDLAAETMLRMVDHKALLEFEESPILLKRVVGSNDVDIAAMVLQLGNSDWVRAGRVFHDENDDVCPFCQQATTASLKKDLDDFFDMTFEAEAQAIATLHQSYKDTSERVLQQVESVLGTPVPHVDTAALKTEVDLFDAMVKANLSLLASKEREPSLAISLESTESVITGIRDRISRANALILDHNRLVTNAIQERRNLTSDVWRYMLDSELEGALTAYLRESQRLDLGISTLTLKISEAEAKKRHATTELGVLEKQTTSIQPTVDGMNRLLASFGFHGFEVAQAGDGKSYKLIRPDGSEAHSTLSEGERTFVTFLYFYHSIEGSESSSGMSVDRVVVLDDPISSLDSEILFIVSSLIKVLLEQVRSGTGYVKQVIVLTHNVYFHKEVAFSSNPQERRENERRFWVIRKAANGSTIRSYGAVNPIKTSYELLWAEVKDPERSSLTLQNTLRRILENYFKILGNIDSDRICGMFEGPEQLVCRSLFSWINDGSHSAHDDLYLAIDEPAVNTYLKVFKDIFVKADHFGHYEMMMNERVVA